MTKVPKLDFFNKFKHANFFETEDRLKIGILYFITSFLTGSEASKTTIPKLYFDLVESGQYVNFPWGNECFRLTLKACSRRLGKNPTSFKFSQFHIALQVWFYECCHPFDNSVAIRVSNVTPRIINWKTSNESIFFDDLKNTIFRTHGNQHKFRNIVLTEEELNAMDQINLHQSSSQHEIENQATSERHNADFDEKYVELKKEIAEVRMELKELKDNVDKHMTDMKAYVDNSTKLIIEEIRSSRGQPSQATHQQDDARQHVEESEKAPMDQPSVSMREYVHTSNTDDEAQKSNDQTIGVVFNADIPGSSNSKPPTLDDYPDFTMTQIVALDPILNANTGLRRRREGEEKKGRRGEEINKFPTRSSWIFIGGDPYQGIGFVVEVVGIVGLELEKREEPKNSQFAEEIDGLDLRTVDPLRNSTLRILKI
ncbi:hypothetical protein KY285_008982 [Solanum tuberosum]|nr:hypothetical protein KY289_007525 [Solanum tuberosum]KAH0747325.1 hypothetical protein KY285_008982 [Solanum tuberosum]